MNENMMEFYNEQGIAIPMTLRAPAREKTGYGLRYRMDGDTETRERYFNMYADRECFISRLRMGSRCEFFEYIEDMEVEDDN